MDKIEYIVNTFASGGIEISIKQAEKYLVLYDFMIEYNENVNLTAITGFEDVVMKHFVDSVLPFSRLEISKNASFIDVGTGAGFPSLPLLIYRDDLNATLCDSLGKRCVYLEKVCDKLEIKAEIIHARSEELGRKRREYYDFSTARAVAAMPVLMEYCLPFVKTGGSFIALKSVNEDIAAAEGAAKILGGEKPQITDYKLPNGDDRRLVITKKITPTPTKCPRNSANIAKKPL